MPTRNDEVARVRLSGPGVLAAEGEHAAEDGESAHCGRDQRSAGAETGK
jgi:hypothetical protein